MTQKRYNNLLMLYIHKERIDSVDLRELAKALAEKNDRRMSQIFWQILRVADISYKHVSSTNIDLTFI